MRKASSGELAGKGKTLFPAIQSSRKVWFWWAVSTYEAADLLVLVGQGGVFWPAEIGVYYMTKALKLCSCPVLELILKCSLQLVKQGHWHEPNSYTEKEISTEYFFCTIPLCMWKPISKQFRGQKSRGHLRLTDGKDEGLVLLSLYSIVSLFTQILQSVPGAPAHHKTWSINTVWRTEAGDPCFAV